VHSSITVNELRIRGNKCPFSTQPGEINGAFSRKHWLRKFKNIFHYAEESKHEKYLYLILDQNRKYSKSLYSILDWLELSKKPSHDNAPLKPLRDAHCIHKKATIKVKGRQKDLISFMKFI
jgi:hypothetical protein